MNKYSIMSDIKTCKKNLEKTLKEYYNKIMKEYNDDYKKYIKIAKKDLKNLENKKNKNPEDLKMIEYKSKEIHKYTHRLHEFNEAIKVDIKNALDIILCNPNCKNTLADTTIDKNVLPKSTKEFIERLKNSKLISNKKANDMINEYKKIRLETYNNLLENSFTNAINKTQIKKIKDKGALSFCSLIKNDIKQVL